LAITEGLCLSPDTEKQRRVSEPVGAFRSQYTRTPPKPTLTTLPMTLSHSVSMVAIPVTIYRIWLRWLKYDSLGVSTLYSSQVAEEDF
jgi:hypothetical protein